MAIVKDPALSLEASGNVGPLCYSRWRELQVVRGAWTGTQTATGPQLAQRLWLITCAQHWATSMTIAQYRAWDELAKGRRWTSRLGSVFTPSGYQLFCSWNMERLVMGLFVLSDPPLVPVASSPTTFHVIYNIWVDRIRLDLRGWTVGEAPRLVQYWRAGPYDSGGRRAIAPEYRLKYQQENPAGNYQWFDLDVILTKWYWYKARPVWLWGESGNFFYCHGQKTAVAGWPPTTYCRDNS